jgi:hypothetical protein
MEWITDDKNHNPIRHINTGEVKLSLTEVLDAINYGFEYANREDKPCITVIRLSVNKAVKDAFGKPKFK